MRTVSPIKAITHALRSVVSYPAVALRIGLFWIPLLFVMVLIEAWMSATVPQQAEQPGTLNIIQIASTIVGLIAVSSMAVNWHRFVLRDELGSPARLDRNVWRYFGNFLLIMLMVAVPTAIVAAVLLSFLGQAASIVLLPIVIVAGTMLYRLSVKLPAVALGNAAFTFREAWRATEGNFWQLLGVFLLNIAMLLGAVLIYMVVVNLVNVVNSTLALVIALLIGAAIQLFFTLFNASVFTSLYGFFVERREF